jgi:hypothetical protein
LADHLLSLYSLKAKYKWDAKLVIAVVNIVFVLCVGDACLISVSEI